ncbi:MAG: RidA family protein [Clostridiaceae bacterium]|nr:RidA family protein [Clostridiaceae bacterium]
MKYTNTENAPAAIGPYSQAIAHNGFLFASGQIALTPGTGEVAGDTIQEQAERCCLNVKAILEANGLTFANVIKTTCFLADMADFATFNEVYEKYFTSKPARSCVAVKAIPKGLLCEIEIIAAM